MTKLAFQGPESEIEKLGLQLQEQGYNCSKFLSDGFDGVAIATLVIDFLQSVAPPAAAVFAAKIATKKQVQVKINGIEVNANSEIEALTIINELNVRANVKK